MIDALALARDLVRIPSINPPGAEQACASHIAQVLDSLGFTVHLESFGAGRFNVIADLAGRAPGLPIGFTGHLDTVPLGAAAWTHDPHAGHIHEGKLYGRGTSDMKAGIAAFVAACSQDMDALRAGTGVQLLLTGGEETGCDGARAMARDSAHLVRQLSLLIVGEPTANYPCIGHKGALWLSGVATGKTAHGSMPERGENAIYKAVRAVQQLEQFDLRTLPHALMGSPTLNVGTFHSGLNINSVPDRAEFTVDIRTVPGMRHECLCSRLRHLLTDQIALEPLVDVPALGTDPQDRAMARVFAVCERILGTKIVDKSVPYFTDGSTLLPITGQPPVVILGPGEPAMAHQTDEYCEIARIAQSVRIYSEILAPVQR